jgi:Outer membrane protein beta-barrel domain
VKKGHIVFIAFLFLLGGQAAMAQSVPAFEVAGGYSYMNFHSNLPSLTSENLNGGGGAVVFNVNSWFGIKADLMDYAFGSAWSTTLHELGFVGPAGANLFTYQFGPQIKWRAHKWQPFVETLYGGAHSKGFASVLQARGNGTNLLVGGGNHNAFAMEIGGGLDIPLSKTIQVRPVEVDYQLTRFGYKAYSANQNNFKYFGGINFTFGQR